MTKTKKICPYCKQSIAIHRHFFNGALADLLLSVAKHFKALEPFHLQRDLTLTKSEYCNFQKLQYWNLAQKAYKEHKRLSGCWVLTPNVEGLLHEQRVIPEWVGTFNNEVVSQSENMILFHEAAGPFSIPECWARRSVSMFQGQEEQLMLFD